MVLILETKKRDKKDDLEKLRHDNMMPAVYYGKKVESTPVSVSLKEFKKVLKEAGESSVFKLKTGKDTLDVLINAIDLNPVTEEPRHADFYVIEKGQTITVNVPLVFVGESPAVKNLGGLLVKVLHELEVEASPDDVPHEIEVDVSSIIDFDTRISVKDLKPIAKVKINNDLEETIAMVSEPKEEEEEVVPEIDMDSIDVEKKGKEEGGEETSAETEKSASEEDQSQAEK